MPKREGPTQAEMRENPEEGALLPRVSSDTLNAFYSDLRQSGTEGLSQRVTAYLQRTNPVFLEEIMRILEKDPPKSPVEALALIKLAIEMLRRQAEADHMEKQFGETEEK